MQTTLPIRKSKKVPESFSDKLLQAVFYLIAAASAFLCLYPFLQVLMSSFADEVTLVREGYQLIPSKFSLDAYTTIFNNTAILKAYGVTLFTTIAGTFLSVFVTAMASFALSGKKMKYRNFFNTMFYLTMIFSGGLVPSYILITNYLNLQDNILVYIIPSAFNVWNMFLLKNFFNEIPNEIIESAQIDGASEFQILMKIILPLSLPAIATISLFTALGFWNEWMTSVLYINDPNLYSLQYMIVRMVNNVSAAQNIGQIGLPAGIITVPAQTLRLATSIITIGPIILLYPFLQKYFVSGLRVGGVKG